MKLLYQFCSCNDKKIRIKKLCHITKGQLLCTLYLFILILDVFVLEGIEKADQAITKVSCGYTYEYKQMHKSCKEIRKHISSSKELIHFPSTSISQNANKSIKEFENLLEQKIKIFNLLKEEQKICAINFINNELKEKAKFYRMILCFNFVIFCFVVFWMCCMPLGVVYNEGEIIPPPIVYPYFIFMLVLLLKAFFLITLINGIQLAKIEDIEKYLLNC